MGLSSLKPQGSLPCQVPGKSKIFAKQAVMVRLDKARDMAVSTCACGEGCGSGCVWVPGSGGLFWVCLCEDTAGLLTVRDYRDKEGNADMGAFQNRPRQKSLSAPK